MFAVRWSRNDKRRMANDNGIEHKLIPMLNIYQCRSTVCTGLRARARSRMMVAAAVERASAKCVKPEQDACAPKGQK